MSEGWFTHQLLLYSIQALQTSDVLLSLTMQEDSQTEYMILSSSAQKYPNPLEELDFQSTKLGLKVRISRVPMGTEWFSTNA